MLPWSVAWLRVALDDHADSKIFGTSASGHIEHAHPISPSGEGFQTYSILGSSLGRQYVDLRVRDSHVAAFAARHAADPSSLFVVGETGWQHGGRFRPHRSHQNGTSVDIFMPLADSHGAPVTIGTWPWNKLGYALEFDERGRLGDQHIDFEAVAAFLLELDQQARTRGLRISRVFIAPEFVPLVSKTPSGQKLGALGELLSRKPAWVRHDEHFHVDFEPR
ncbi:MAG: penicillin-insensitive murein endopeptidase [Deltaproteobacteria bacterium]|nr:penicillin-insensitive murein endopeptidase [Deltaproteobacteria bacterium]